MDEQLQYLESDVCAVTIALDLTVYIAAPFPDVREGVLEFYNNFIKLFGNSVKWYATESMKIMEPASDRALNMIPSWFKPAARARNEYGMFMHAGLTREGVSDITFDMFGDTDDDTSNYLRMTIPVFYINNGVAPFIELVKTSVDKLPFLSGHAGFSFVLDTRGAYEGKAMGKIKGWAFRYPGIDIGKPLSTIWYTMDAVKSVNWLNLINYNFCERLGGVETIKKELGDDIPVHQLPNGIMIQAGPKPETGDVNRGENLPFYRKAAKVLQPIRLNKHRPIGLMDAETTMAWFARFDE